MILNLLLTTISVLGAVLALWDYGRRRLISQAFRQDKLVLAAQELKIVAEGYARQLRHVETALDDSTERVRLVLSAFINSATDIISISEEEKKHLRNKLATAQLNKK